MIAIMRLKGSLDGSGRDDSEAGVRSTAVRAL